MASIGKRWRRFGGGSVTGLREYQQRANPMQRLSESLRAPHVWKEEYAQIPEVTLNRGERITLWLNSQEGFVQDGHTDDDWSPRLEISITLDGLLTIKGPQGEWVDRSGVTKVIEYRGKGR